MLHPQDIRARKVSQDLEVPTEFLDATCYFITATAFDTLLQCTTNHSPSRQSPSSGPSSRSSSTSSASSSASSSSSSRPKRLSISTSTTHFFTGSLVSTDPPMILATGTAVSVLEREWQNYFVLLDLNGVAPFGRLPSLFSTFSCVHAVSKGYPLGSFGEIQWMLLGLSPLRNHIPSGPSLNLSNNPIHTRSRWRSNSLPPSTYSPLTPEDAYAGHPELNPSCSVTYDLNQASSYTPSPEEIIASNASVFFRQAPTRSIHSLVRARMACLYTTSSYTRTITVRVFFGSNPGSSTTTSSSSSSSPWRLEGGMMVALNDGVISSEDSWVLGGNGRAHLSADQEYNFTLTSGLAMDGTLKCPAAMFRELRLVRRDGVAWKERGDLDRVWPQAFVEVGDGADERIAFTLGPVAFERTGVEGNEWRGVIPKCIEYC